MDVLQGVAEYLTQKGFRVDNWNPLGGQLDNPAILVSSDDWRRAVRCQIVHGMLRVAAHTGLPHFDKTIDLIDADALGRVHNVMKKHLVKRSFAVRGGISD